ncbi:hypothetical protein C1645_756302 [Glomus cerebriforme]|uniref:Uncharacterized protein n=1 Tax=Glomus cerebriforme TaxID=658196 RepID=A0A397TG63_9GLOM|nr:hypothetical protein C1645_756302 [Glomus cerebriforme]
MMTLIIHLSCYFYLLSKFHLFFLSEKKWMHYTLPARSFFISFFLNGTFFLQFVAEYGPLCHVINTVIIAISLLQVFQFHYYWYKCLNQES